MLLTAGCSKRQEPASQATTTTRAPDILSYDDATVGNRDPLVNSIAPHLQPWLVLWRHAYAGFTPDSLIKIGTEPAFRDGFLQPVHEVYPPPKESASAFRVLSARSPDGRYDLIFDRYQCITEEGERVEIGGDADSAPLLLDTKRGTSNRFEFCGPGSCAFHWGAWVSPAQFVLTGTQYDEKHMGIRGRVQVYSLRDSTVTTYLTRPLHSSRAATYQAAWESWVVSQYRATKQVASRS